MLLDQFDSNAYLQSATGSPADGNRFFLPYLIHLQSPWDVVSTGRQLLHKCYNADSLAYTHIYKGWIYFYLGLASFRLQDYEIALFFIDNAISCDIQAQIDSVKNPSHAMRLIQLDSTLPEHKDFIGDTETRIADVIRIYKARPESHPLSVFDLRNKFLLPSMDGNHQNWRTLSTTLISLCLEWNYRDELFTICPEPSTSEPYFLHLFKGCVLFESLLKENNSADPWRPVSPKKNTLGHVLEKYSSALGSSENLGKNNSGNLQDIISDLKSANDSIFTAIKFTARLRNTVGHNLGWKESLNKNQYQLLFQMVTSSCLHVIACIYP